MNTAGLGAHVDDGDLFLNAERGAETVHWADPENVYTTAGYSVDIVIEREDGLCDLSGTVYAVTDTAELDMQKAPDRDVLTQIMTKSMSLKHENADRTEILFHITTDHATNTTEFEVGMVAVYFD